MALPGRTNQSSSRVSLHPHAGARTGASGGGLPAARPQLPRRPQPVEEEPQEELQFDDGTDMGAYDDSAYMDDGDANAYNQQTSDNGGMYAPQPSDSQPSSFAARAAMLNQQSMQSQAAVPNMNIPNPNTAGQSYYQPPQVPQSTQMPQVSQMPTMQASSAPLSEDSANDMLTEPPSGGNDAPKKRRKYNRNNKSELKSGGAVGENSARIWRYVIVGLLVVFVVLSGKNALIPPKSMSAAQVQQIALQATGNTGFPMAEGAGIAQAFAQAYVPISGDSGATAVLSNFYTGQKFDPSGSNAISGITPTSNGSITQQIKSGPFVFSELPVDSKSANFVVGMLVYQTLDGDVLLTGEGGQKVNYKWLYLNIGVVYDPVKKTFAIDKNSPTVVSKPDMKASSDLENAKAPGSGKTDDDVTQHAKDSVINFMKAWGQSDKSALTTLVTKNHTANTMNGLGGTYTLSDDSSGLQFEAYGKPAGDSYYRGLVTVKWVDKITSDQIKATKEAVGKGSEVNANQENTVTYTSKYLLKIAKSDDGKYLIQDILPYYYFPDAAK